MEILKSLVSMLVIIVLIIGCRQRYYVYSNDEIATEKQYSEETTIDREFYFTEKIFVITDSPRLVIEEYIDNVTNKHYGLISGQGWYNGIIPITNPEIMEGPNGERRFSIKESININFENKSSYTGCVVYDAVADVEYCFIDGYGYISGAF